MNIHERADERIVIVALRQGAGDREGEDADQDKADGPGELFTVHDDGILVVPSLSSTSLRTAKAASTGWKPVLRVRCEFSDRAGHFIGLLHRRHVARPGDGHEL